jgi:hypothetical protein
MLARLPAAVTFQTEEKQHAMWIEAFLFMNTSLQNYFK